MSLNSIKTVAVLCAGTMGNGVTHVFAHAGYNVIFRDVLYNLAVLSASGTNWSYAVTERIVHV